ncbi:MAG: MBL fold metallo-hydrolase, partial [Angelakisella sp.]
MSQQKRRPKKGTVTTLIVAAAAAIIVSLQPMLADYGIDLQQILTDLFRGQALQTAVYPSEGTAEVHFLDVGQASCILIKGSEKTALIDAGEADTVGDVTDYLAENGVTKIDYFFNTHPHADHMGGCRGVMEAVPTGEFIMTDLPKDIVPTTV